jgi:hypothetical protein
VQVLAQARERHYRVPAYLSIREARQGMPAATIVGSGSSGGSGSWTSTKESPRDRRQSLIKATNEALSLG